MYGKTYFFNKAEKSTSLEYKPVLS